MKQGSKRLYALLPLLAAAALAVLVGVDYQNTKKAARQVTAQYSWLGWDAFDTITNVIGNAQSEEEWNSQMQAFHEDLLEYHRLYDIYNTYEGVVNLANVNEMAGKGPVQVDERIIALLQEAKAVYAQTNGKTNVAAGAVLSLWHDARTAGLEDAQNAALPSEQALQQAAGHCNIEDLVIDEAAGTVELKDPAMRLDVGSIGKGFAVEQCARAAEQRGLASASISVGGNIQKCSGPRIHVAHTGQVENFHLLPQLIHDPFKRRYLLVGCVGENSEELLKSLDMMRQHPAWD